MRFDILCFGLPGGMEWIVILVVCVLIFGTRIPTIARSIGQSYNEFRKGIKEVNDTKEELKQDIKDSLDTK